MAELDAEMDFATVSCFAALQYRYFWAGVQHFQLV